MSAVPTEAVILVVDDNAAKRLSIVSILEQLGHRTIEVDSGEAALRIAADEVQEKEVE